MSVTAMSAASGNRPRMFKVLCPIERKDHSTFWMRVGTGYVNKDQSVNLYLDVLPANQKLQLREMEEEDFAPNPRGKRHDDGGQRTFDRASDPPPF